MTGDTTIYYVTPLYFYVTVVISCTPAFTLTTKPESPFIYRISPVSSTLTTKEEINFTDTNGCGITPTYSCKIGGVPCPSWININASNKMTVKTNSPANIGQYSVTIEASYVNLLGVPVALPSTNWVLNVVYVCVPVFALTSQPESPFSYTV